MKANSETIATSLLTDYVRRGLARGGNDKTVESIGHMLVGLRIARMYRVEASEEGRELLARQLLRGILSDTIS